MQDGGTHLETAEVDICAGHIGNDCYEHRVALRSRCLGVGASGLHLTAVFSEQVDLPDGIKSAKLVDVLQAAGGISRAQWLIGEALGEVRSGPPACCPAGG